MLIEWTFDWMLDAFQRKDWNHEILHFSNEMKLHDITTDHDIVLMWILLLLFLEDELKNSVEQNISRR